METFFRKVDFMASLLAKSKIELGLETASKGSKVLSLLKMSKADKVMELLGSSKGQNEGTKYHVLFISSCELVLRCPKILKK